MAYPIYLDVLELPLETTMSPVRILTKSGFKWYTGVIVNQWFAVMYNKENETYSLTHLLSGRKVEVDFDDFTLTVVFAKHIADAWGNELNTEVLNFRELTKNNMTLDHIKSFGMMYKLSCSNKPVSNKMYLQAINEIEKELNFANRGSGG